MPISAAKQRRFPMKIRRRLAARRHTALLVAIVAAFAVRPLIGDRGIAPIVFSVALIILVLIALYNIQIDELVGERDRLIRERRFRIGCGWILAFFAIVERLLVFIAPSRFVVVTGPICWFALIAFIIWQELRAVVRQQRVTGETISIAISIYLLLGFAWGLLYIMLYQVQPGAFSFGGSPSLPAAGPANHLMVFPIMMYYSLTTLSTIGFGDIVPLTLQARYLSVAEGITGQFYLAILVARLVAMQMSSQSSDRRAG